jgi:hypothetical protein
MAAMEVRGHLPRLIEFRSDFPGKAMADNGNVGVHRRRIGAVSVEAAP